jgi:predicted DNA-binding transcriptional regulator AlpA
MPRRNPSQNSALPVLRQNRDAAVPVLVREYLSRRELLALVPLSMSSIDALEKKGEFPSRFVLSPTVKVCWRRHEVLKWLAERARRRVHQASRDRRQ